MLPVEFGRMEYVQERYSRQLVDLSIKIVEPQKLAEAMLSLPKGGDYSDASERLFAEANDEDRIRAALDAFLSWNFDLAERYGIQLMWVRKPGDPPMTF